jgi:hypothetical protein
MSDVLLISALRFSQPVAVFVQMKINDLSRGADRFCLHGFHVTPPHLQFLP